MVRRFAKFSDYCRLTKSHVILWQRREGSKPPTHPCPVEPMRMFAGQVREPGKKRSLGRPNSGLNV